MDPGGMMMNEGGYSLTEIWPFPMNGSMELGHVFGDNRDVCGGDGMVLDKRGGPKKRREEDESGSGKGVSTSTTANDVNDFDSKRLKTSGDENDQPKADTEVNSGKPLEQSSKPAEQPKQDYIHVRARRGQATDSHSLAERARREKISERMKILQDIVPGCNKVIGKALVLDEIINYIQSLQHQVEFLSMKLEAVNSRPNPGIEGFPSKDFDQKTFDMDGFAYTSPATKEYSRDPSPEWLHMQIGGSFERTA